MKYLIDTDWVIDHLAGDPVAVNLLNILVPDGIAISVLTYSEVYVGIFRSPNPKQSEIGFRIFLQSASVLPVTKVVARQNALIRTDLLRRGKSVRRRAFDLVIAATAIRHQLSLVTRNKVDYQDILGLTLY